MIIFNVTVYNPYSSGTNFNLTLDAGENNFVHNWLVFECVSGNCGLSEDAKTATLSIGSISSETVNVRLISPGRAGTYPIRFIAKDLSDQKSYEAKARLQIFSESLPEFEPWQLIIAVAITSLIFALIIEKKKQ